MGGERGKDPHCLSCIHFFVTWDERFPRGCRCFSLKTRNMPSQDVQEAAGRPCPCYQRDPKVQRRKPRSGWELWV